MHLVSFQPLPLPLTLGLTPIITGQKFPPQCFGLGFDLVFRDFLVFELVPQVKDLDFDLAQAVVLEDFGVGLALAVFEGVGGVGGEGGVAGAEVGEVALDVAGGAGATGGGEPDVGGHSCFREGREILVECHDFEVRWS